jgi:cytochrome P450
VGRRPFPLYRRLRDEAPVYWDERNQTFVLTRTTTPTASCSTPGASQRALDILEGRQPPTSEIRQADAPRHRFVRNIVGPLFNPAAMRSREEIIRAIVREIVDAAEGPDVIEISSAIATPLPAWVALGLIGLPQAQHERFNQRMDDRLEMILTRGSRAESSEADLARLAGVREEMWEMVVPVIAERRATRNDAISRVLRSGRGR